MVRPPLLYLGRYAELYLLVGVHIMYKTNGGNMAPANIPESIRNLCLSGFEFYEPRYYQAQFTFNVKFISLAASGGRIREVL
jgi:hypothetical protein